MIARVLSITHCDGDPGISVYVLNINPIGNQCFWKVKIILAETQYFASDEQSRTHPSVKSWTKIDIERINSLAAHACVSPIWTKKTGHTQAKSMLNSVYPADALRNSILWRTKEKTRFRPNECIVADWTTAPVQYFHTEKVPSLSSCLLNKILISCS